MQTSTWAELWHNIEILKLALSHNYKKNLLQATTWAELSQQRATESLVLWALHHLQQVVWPGIFMIRLVFLLKIPFWNIVRFRHSWFQSPCSWVPFPPATTGTALQKKVHVGRSRVVAKKLVITWLLELSSENIFPGLFQRGDGVNVYREDSYSLALYYRCIRYHWDIRHQVMWFT